NPQSPPHTMRGYSQWGLSPGAMATPRAAVTPWRPASHRAMLLTRAPRQPAAKTMSILRNMVLSLYLLHVSRCRLQVAGCTQGACRPTAPNHLTTVSNRSDGVASRPHV